ncbi:SGNH/GDSL hydrolase family protein [Nocardia crassostreae]|uniref:SGNH/GDSL hydrolase family protein n=1 Tax=Nocardia crassostreae TaxID=53428 RepID=UPI001470E9CE|nr:SGNH/GDSL hydrolase family protein [Nocardia crassostreae]
MTTTALAASAAASAPALALPSIDRYVALGDSAAAVGSLDKLQPGSPLFCTRALDNYPSVLAETLGVAEFVDASCSSAKTTNMTQPQTGSGGSPNPPQFEALTSDTDLVTLTIGANDIGALNVNAITDDMLETVRQRVSTVLDGIRERAPHATVVVTSYLRYFPPGGGCFGLVDQGGQQRLTDAFRELAARHNARFADNFAKTGHDMCEPVGTQWVNGPTPTTPTVPLHANVEGQQYLASVVAAALLN